MPELNGLGLLQAIRSDPQLKAAPFLVLTTETCPEKRRRMIAAGADGWLQKPFEIQRSWRSWRPRSRWARIAPPPCAGPHASLARAANCGGW
jgi:CheY-like chemotaxis protein